MPKQSSDKIAALAAEFLAMDDDEMRAAAKIGGTNPSATAWLLLPEHKVILDADYRGNPKVVKHASDVALFEEPRLDPEFCRRVRALAASALVQREGPKKGEQEPGDTPGRDGAAYTPARPPDTGHPRDRKRGARHG